MFWGYQEDPFAKAAKIDNTPFATFQMVWLEKQKLPNGDTRLTVCRGQGGYYFNKIGALAFGLIYHGEPNEVTGLRPGENRMEIEINNNSLSQAMFSSVNLNNLCSVHVNEGYKNQPYKGGIGLISLGHYATFNNVWFMGQP